MSAWSAEDLETFGCKFPCTSPPPAPDWFPPHKRVGIITRDSSERVPPLPPKLMRGHPKENVVCPLNVESSSKVTKRRADPPALSPTGPPCLEEDPYKDSMALEDLERVVP